MTNANLISMIGNVSQSLVPVQGLIKGLGYLLGILFIVTALTKFKKIADSQGHGSSQQKTAGPIIYFFVGAMLLFLPSMMAILSSSTFGTNNVLQYIQYNPPSTLPSAIFPSTSPCDQSCSQCIRAVAPFQCNP